MVEQKRILIMEYSNSSSSSNSVRRINLCSELANQGLKVDVISNISEYDSINELYRISYNTSIKYLSMCLNKLLSFFFLYSDFLTFLSWRYKNKIKHVLKKNKYDSIIICVAPYSLMQLADFLRKRTSAKLILDQCDPLGYNITYQIRKSKYRMSKYRKFEFRYLKKFDLIIVLNNRIKDVYEKTDLGLKSKIIVIEQGFKPIKSFSNKIKKNNQNGNIKIKALYAGYFYNNIREPYELYKALSHFKNIELNIIGEERNCFRIAECSINFLGRKKHDEVVLHSLNSDFLIFIDNFKGLQIPGKLFEIIAMGIPVIYIYENQCGCDEYGIECKYIYKAKNNKNSIINAINNILLHLDEEVIINEDINKYSWCNLVKNKLLPILFK
ncbi:MAG: glycosyltransferase [Bacilli bacterium]